MPKYKVPLNNTSNISMIFDLCGDVLETLSETIYIEQQVFSDTSCSDSMYSQGRRNGFGIG